MKQIKRLKDSSDLRLENTLIMRQKEKNKTFVLFLREFKLFRRGLFRNNISVCVFKGSKDPRNRIKDEGKGKTNEGGT